MALTTEQLMKRIVGTGLSAPIRRLSGSDFVTATGSSAIQSCLHQILGTRRGELPWRPSFGADLERYRHKSLNDISLEDMANAIAEEIRRWEPRVSTVNVTIDREETLFRVRIVWTLAIGSSITGNNVFADPNTAEIVV